jgi:hypothetical protein
MKWFLPLLLFVQLAAAQSPAVLFFRGSSASSPPLTDLLFWGDATDYGTNANGTAVTNWFDLSGNNNHYTNQDAANLPYVTNNVVNGLSAFRFGANGGASTWLHNGNGYLTNSTNAEIFVVLKSQLTNQSALTWLPWNISHPGGNAATEHPNAANIIREAFGTTMHGAVAAMPRVTEPGALTNFHFWNVSVSNNQYIGRFNGDIVGGNDLVNITSIGFSNSTRIGGLISGDGLPTYNGYIAEVLIYGKVLSDSGRDAVNAYLTGKYAIQATNSSLATNIFNPNSFTNLHAWWKVTDINTNDGSPVTNWIDRVSGYQWTNMLVGTTLPIYKSTGFGGVPTLQFLSGGGSNQTMALNGTITLAANTSYTILIMGVYTNIIIVMNGDAGGVSQWILNQSSANKTWVYQSGVFLEATFGRGQNEIRLDSWSRQDTVMTIMQNATNALSGAWTAQQRVNNLVPTGLSAFMNISEICIYTNAFLPPESITKLYYQYFRKEYPALP